MADDLLSRVSQGALGGVAGTLILQGIMMGIQQAYPEAEAPQTEDPASFMLWQVEKHLPKKLWMKIPASAETVAGIGLSIGYGAAFGALYGMCKPKRSSVLLDGVLLGTACWAVGYMGWLPAAKLIPPIWRQTPVQIAGPVIEHIAYGIATVAAYDLIHRKW